MNSRKKRALAFRAKNTGKATTRNLTLIMKVADSFLDVNDKQARQNHKQRDILGNAIRNSKIMSRSKYTKRYADGIQRQH